MSETIFLAQNANGACRELRGTPAPKYSGGYWIGERLDINDYPPPGECWEYRLTRKGDIDTDGEPIGWKIVGIGKDGSVLCEKGNGQRRRYSFADGAKEQPTGEAWEMLLNVVADYVRNVGITGPRGEAVKKAWKAYEAAQSAESKFGECETCGVGQHLPSGACDHCGTKKQEDDPQLAKLLKACRNAYNAGPGARRVLLGSVLHEWAKIDLPSQSAEPSDQQATIERLTKERDEARAELANERSVSDQVIDERNATIAELRSELDETRTERHAYKSRLREFCQRLVDMVGAEGPEDVQGMLDKVNAEINRLKQSIDSLSANLADKEGFLNSAGDEIERLTKERDEAVTELRDKLERPEMPECVRELLDAVCLEVPGLFAQKIAAVRDHYAPPLKFEVGGVYISSDERSEWELLKIARNGTMLFWGTTSEAVMRTDESGVSNIGGIKIVKRVR